MVQRVTTLTMAKIDECFEGKAHQNDVVVALYKLAYPDWDQIANFDGFTSVGAEAGSYIMSEFMQFDRIHHEYRQRESGELGVMAGGLWMNKGFSTLGNERLGLWDLERLDDQSIEFKVAPPGASDCK